MTGDGLVRPLNAPAGQPSAYGTQPGTTSPVVIANRVIVFGSGPGTGVFIYDPSPGLGNLISSSTDATIDPYGNATLPGNTGYSKIGGTFYATQAGGTGLAAVTAFYTATSAAGPYTLQGFITGTGSAITISSNHGLILAPGAGPVIITMPSTLSGGAPVSQIDRTVLSAGNTGTATDITNTWTIPAADGANGAKYTIETHVTATTGPTTIETLTLGLDLNAGTLVALATLGTAFNGGALSVTYEIPVRLTLIPAAGSSASNAQIVLSASLADSSVNRLSTNSANMGGRSDTTAFNPANANTVALYAQWGGAGGSGQTAGTRWSEFTRSGQS